MLPCAPAHSTVMPRKKCAFAGSSSRHCTWLVTMPFLQVHISTAGDPVQVLREQLETEEALAATDKATASLASYHAAVDVERVDYVLVQQLLAFLYSEGDFQGAEVPHPAFILYTDSLNAAAAFVLLSMPPAEIDTSDA